MSKTKMPKDLESKCKIAIHTATTAAATAGALPIPIADTIPITAAQVTMIVALGKFLTCQYLNQQQSRLQQLRLHKVQVGLPFPEF